MLRAPIRSSHKHDCLSCVLRREWVTARLENPTILPWFRDGGLPAKTALAGLVEPVIIDADGPSHLQQ